MFDRWAASEMPIRDLLIHKEPMFTANAVPGQEERPLPSRVIRDWRRRRLIFGVRYKSRDYFPAFQFRDGRPKSIIGRLVNLLRLARREDNWFLLYWFVGANRWLESDAAPVGVMDSNEDAVTEAALHAKDPTGD
jgi:hypothetical protein